MIVKMSKGKQVTIPAEIRNRFDLIAGSKFEIYSKDSQIVLKPIGNGLNRMFRQAKWVKPKQNLNSKQMDELNERQLR